MVKIYTLEIRVAFDEFDPPTLASVVPSSGPETGGTAVTLTGTGFTADSPGPNAVTFDGVSATSIVTVNDTTITCVTPAGSGTVDVVVTNNFGAVTLTNGFTYYDDVNFKEMEGKVVTGNTRGSVGDGAHVGLVAKGETRGAVASGNVQGTVIVGDSKGAR